MDDWTTQEKIDAIEELIVDSNLELNYAKEDGVSSLVYSINQVLTESYRQLAALKAEAV
tara:strand:+ start:2240 stop:2416 length:177 start_codon:yes stop_codon:yes gene_type:complete